ncbi:sensor histidine kinase [Caulobacter sp. KR2-114]|uniref:sensor histidine kinase n=1 Tax=Caulobacter sp. KR2-114 TaxID=3400912 RepID=UPI003C06C69D
MSEPAPLPEDQPRAPWRAGLAAVIAAAGVVLGVTLHMGGIGGLAVAAAVALAVFVTVTRRPPSRPIVPVAPPAVAEAPRPADLVPPFDRTVEILPDPLLLVTGMDPDDLIDRRFVYANAAARELFRITRGSGPLATAVRAPEVLEAVDEALFGAVTGEAAYQPGGAQDRIWRAMAQPLATEPDAPRLALLIFRDETEVRRAERTRADFLANASHELRTPLASLAGFIETLRGHAREDENARDKFLAIMQVQAERMRRLIEDLMSLSRIELNEHVPPSGKVDVALAAVDVLDALGPIAAERCLSFRQSLPPRGVAVVGGDRDQILQVIQNLVENAMKYSPSRGEVTLEMRLDLDAAEAGAPRASGGAHLSLLTPDHAAGLKYVALTVRDSGPGIAREHLPRLTERFYRVEGQKSGGERSGTGLGLAIVKHIMNRHRGGLMVESVEGAGAAFTVYFPTAVAAVQAAA